MVIIPLCSIGRVSGRVLPRDPRRWLFRLCHRGCTESGSTGPGGRCCRGSHLGGGESITDPAALRSATNLPHGGELMVGRRALIEVKQVVDQNVGASRASPVPV